MAGDRNRALLHFDATDPTLAGYAWDFPTIVAGRPLVSRGVYRLKVIGPDAQHQEPTQELGTLLDARLRALGLDPRVYAKKRYAERGFEPATRLARGGRMLVGEAAGIDAATGEGIAQAIEYGVLAGRYLARSFQRDPEGSIDVCDWDDEMKGSRLARDLRARAQFIQIFYGPSRRDLERFVVRCPDALFVGAQSFAAQRVHRLRLGKVVTQGAAQIAATRARALLA
jgi:flavin-dependent dehydrogenase